MPLAAVMVGDVERTLGRDDASVTVKDETGKFFGTHPSQGGTHSIA